MHLLQDWKPASVNIFVKGTEYTFDFSYRSSLEPLAELVRSRKVCIHLILESYGIVALLAAV